jgi:hypothetical protein
VECSFCGIASPRVFRLPQGSSWTCERCTTRLADLLHEEPRMARIWPALSEPDDDDEPEPMVRLADGSKVALKSRTEELKKDLTPPQRAELMATYVELEMFKEALMEAARVLREGGQAERERVLEMLFSLPLAAADAPEQLRPFLLPV